MEEITESQGLDPAYWRKLFGQSQQIYGLTLIVRLSRLPYTEALVVTVAKVK